MDDNDKTPLLIAELSQDELPQNISHFGLMVGFTDTIKLIMATDEVIHVTIYIKKHTLILYMRRFRNI
jgi:hypothetical protein